METQPYDSGSGCMDADPRFIEILSKWEKCLGSDPLYTASLNSLAEMYRSAGRNADSEIYRVELVKAGKQLN